MNIRPITYSYKRQIEQGFRNFTQVLGSDIKDQLRYLWGEEVKTNVITSELYKKYTGEDYVVITEPTIN